MTDKKLLSFSKMLQQQEEQRQAEKPAVELRPVESISLTETISPTEITSPVLTPPLALQTTSPVKSTSLAEYASPVESTMDIWASFTDWKDGHLQLPNMIALVLYRHLDPAERAIYQELYQLSWGFGNPTCKVSLTRLAERAGMKQTAAHQAVKRLAAKGLVIKSQMIFGKGLEQGIEYSLPLPTRLVESIRLARSTSPAENVNNKIKALKEINKKESEISHCEKCKDSGGFIYPNGPQGGVVKCKHE